MFKKNEKVVEAVVDEEKSYFFPRLIAFIIDILVIAVISFGVSYMIPENKNMDKYETESKEIIEEFQNGKIGVDDYLHKISPVAHDIDYANIPSSLVSLVIGIGYFIVYQFYNKGQTVGKKIMKIKIISIKGNELTLNQVAYHALFINNIIFKLISVGLVLFMNNDYYYTSSVTLDIFALIFMVIAVAMVVFKKDGRGLHDVIASTKVVKSN